MDIPRNVQDIAIHFDKDLGYTKCSTVLVDGAFLPVVSVAIVATSNDVGYVELRVPLSKVRIVEAQDLEEEDEFD